MEKALLRSACFFTYFSAFLILISCESDPVPVTPASAQILHETYGSDPRQSMDIYLPAERSTDQTPLLVYIHGGAWIDGDKSEFLQIKPLLEEKFQGYAFVALNYRLFDFATGSYRIADQEQDIVSAFNHIDSRLDAWSISGEIVISGASAGGHLALLHAFKNNSSDLKAAIAFFPPTELATFHQFNNATALALNGLLGGTPQSVADRYHDASPTRFVDDRDVPTIFFHGDLDQVVPISQSLLLQGALQTSNVRHQFVTVNGQGHGFAAETYRELFRQARNFVGEF